MFNVHVLSPIYLQNSSGKKMIRQISKATLSKWNRQLCRSVSSSTTTSYPSINSLHRIHTPEDGYIVSSPFEPITIPDLTIDQYVWKNLSKWQNKVAIVSFRFALYVFLSGKNNDLLDMWSYWSEIYLLEIARSLCRFSNSPTKKN